MSEPPLLEVHGLSAGYGRSQVLFDVSLAAKPCGVIAILGRNGAGKTTLMKTIMGELRSTSGAVSVAGRDLTRMSTERRVRLGLGYVPQEYAVFGRLSVRENLQVGMLMGRDRASLDRILAMFPKLAERLEQMASTLSGGERKMLAIGRALLANPTFFCSTSRLRACGSVSSRRSRNGCAISLTRSASSSSSSISISR